MALGTYDIISWNNRIIGKGQESLITSLEKNEQKNENTEIFA